jgi:hypothetical protein
VSERKPELMGVAPIGVVEYWSDGFREMKK